MKPPNEYTSQRFLGLHIVVVDDGTVITDERTGDEVTISDTTFVKKGATIFCTQNTFDGMKRKLQ